MVSGPLNSAGLKCSFHFKFPYLFGLTGHSKKSVL